jgi:hypothetical protein
VTAGTDGVVEKSSDEVLQDQDGVRGGPQHTDKHEKVPMGWLTRKGSGGSVVKVRQRSGDPPSGRQVR